MIGEKLGSFRIESVLGSGSTAMVYRATNEKTGLTSAVKVLRGGLPDGRATLARFEREAQILQQFRHPNIVRFLAMGHFRETSYLAMEFIDGTTLERILQDHGRLPWQKVIELGMQICEALQYVHNCGVVHRDLKPSELMLTVSGQIKLIDFGIARNLDATALTGTGRSLGTPAYMSPEQTDGTHPISHKTDLYALGCVLYQMLVGKKPFAGSKPEILMHSHLTEAPPRPGAIVDEVPPALDKLIARLMARLPAHRPQGAEAVRGMLSQILGKT